MPVIVFVIHLYIVFLILGIKVAKVLIMKILHGIFGKTFDIGV